MTITLEPTYSVSPDDEEVVGIDFTDHLRSGELLTGTPIVTEITTSDLSLTNKFVNTATVVILDRTVAIGKAALFKVSGMEAGTTYRINIQVDTDADVPRQISRDILLDCG